MQYHILLSRWSGFLEFSNHQPLPSPQWLSLLHINLFVPVKFGCNGTGQLQLLSSDSISLFRLLRRTH